MAAASAWSVRITASNVCFFIYELNSVAVHDTLSCIDLFEKLQRIGSDVKTIQKARISLDVGRIALTDIIAKAVICLMSIMDNFNKLVMQVTTHD